MVQVVIALPRDLTLLSSMIYEGLLFTVQFSRAKSHGFVLNLPNDFLVTALKKLKDERISKIGIKMTTTDNIREKIFTIIGVGDTNEKAYSDFILKVKKYANKFITTRNIKLSIQFGKHDSKDAMIVDADEGLSAQLLKIDRYTGITSLESNYTSKQVTLYTSKEALLLFLFGLYSSYVTQQRGTTPLFFLLTFSPEEIEDMLNNIEDQEYIKKLFRTKNSVINILSNVLNNTSVDEALLLEVNLNTEIRRLLERENLNRISLVLFKIAQEGRTYKIYEQLPITIHREPKSCNVIKKYFKDPEGFLQKLAEVFRPGSVIFEVMRGADNYKEADNILRAVYNIYKFIILGDISGWYGFLREINNAYQKLKDSKEQRDIRRKNFYKSVLRTFAI